MPPPQTAPVIKPLRVRVFVDFWNFQLSLRGAQDGFKTDWNPIGQLLTREAAALIDPTNPSLFEGMHVYGSYDRDKPQDQKLKNWFTNWLDKQPGVHVTLLERQRKRSHPRCAACHFEVEKCPSCKQDMRGTEEKGVDTRMATDMLNLAWQDAFDAAVLVSSDRDFVPVAEHLQNRGVKVVHAAFPPRGSELSQKCWGSVRVPDLMAQFSR